MSEVTTHFEGHANRECGEHRTVGSHRAWCHDCTEWCYPEIPCRGCKIPQLEAELEATQRLVQAAHNWQEEGFTHWALTPAVEGYKDATEKGDTETLSWKARAEQNYAEWEEANKKIERLEEDVRQYRAMAEAAERERWVDANHYAILKQRVYKLLEQTIEVLEGFDWTWLKHEPEWAEGFEWLKDRMDPLLDNLKALKREPDVHQQAVAEMLAPKPIDHVDGGFKP